MLRHTRRRMKVRISKLEFRLGIRLALSAVLAMVVGQMLGLHASYWAGISAIIVSTGTPGGSFSASLRRFESTMIGLGAGILSVWGLGHNLVAAATAIMVAILVSQAVGLKSAVRVAALSTLFPIALTGDAQGISAAMATVLFRAENVLVGCGVTLLIDGLIWPERVTAKFLARVRKDIDRVGRLASDLVEAYRTGQDHAFDSAILDLQKGRLDYTELLKDLGAEPGDRDSPRERLSSQAEILHQLVDHCAALRDIQRRATGDTAQNLIRDEFQTLARTIREASDAFSRGGPEFQRSLDALRMAGLRLEAAYEGIRGDKGTQTFPSQEVFHLLGVLYLCGALVRSLNNLAPTAEEPQLPLEG